MKLWDFFDSAYYDYQPDFDLLNKVQVLTDNFDEVKLNMICDEFDFYSFMKKEEWLGSFEDGEVQKAMHKLEREGKKVPMISDSKRSPLSVSHYFKKPKVKKISKNDSELTEKEKNDRDKILKEMDDLYSKTIDVEKIMDPHNVEFSGLYRLRNILIDLKRKHTNEVYKFEDEPKDSFNPFTKNFNSDKSDTYKFFESVNAGELSKLDMQNRVQKLTDNYDEDKLNLLCNEFDEYIFVKYENWRGTFTQDEISERISKRIEEGFKLPYKGEEKNKYHLPFVNDFFLKTRYGKPISDEEFERHMDEIFGKVNNDKIIDDNVLLGGFYFNTESRSLLNLREILVDLKKKHTTSVYKFDEHKPQKNNIQPIHWLQKEETLKQFLQSLKSAGFIENKETDEIIQEHFRQTDQTPQPIQWSKSNRLLIYLFNKLSEAGLIDTMDRQFRLITDHFLDKKGQPFKRDSIKQDSINMRYSNDPRGSETIDSIIQELTD